jgi:hypothetical protein
LTVLSNFNKNKKQEDKKLWQIQLPPSLKLTVQATGENSGTWGQITNTNLLILEQAIGGFSSVALNATTGATLTFSNGALSNGKDACYQINWYNHNKRKRNYS